MLFRTRAAGAQGERLAAQFLKKRGYRILRRNWRTPQGEIDLVAREGDAVVFVEVKARTSRTWDLPEAAVTAAKQKRIALAAATFAARYRLRERPLRFDILAILIEEGVEPQYKHYPDAFPLPSFINW